jgi:luciferase family oxidoreductase group 1
MRASILDIQSPLHLPDVVAVAEASGYTRYWVTEHYSSKQSASPTLATALAGGVSDRLRVGFGGVLLRLHAPLRVAADVALLRAFFPDRVDVGIAGSPVGDEVARALTGGAAADDALYRARIEELVARLADDKTPCGGLTDDVPQVWLCGTSLRTARLAGELGLRYAYHHHLARAHGERPDIGAAYRDAFRPSAMTDAPTFAIAAYGVVADQGDVARIWNHGESGSAMPTFGGTAAECAEQLEGLVDRLGADELFLDCFALRLADRLDALRGVAEALGLGDEPQQRPEFAVEVI